MEIRYIKAACERHQISSIYEKSWKYAYKGIIPQDYLDSIPEGRWADRIERTGWNNIAAEDNGILVGTACFCASRWEKYSGCGEVVSLYLLPEYMERGIGRRLMDFCIKELGSQGFTSVILWVLEENTRARGFYEHMGFTLTDEIQESIFSGRTVREVMYILDTEVKE